MWSQGDVVTISMTYDEHSQKVRCAFSGHDDGSGTPWSFVEHFAPSNLPSALYGFAAGLRALLMGEWS